jgi:hypothetical protein
MTLNSDVGVDMDMLAAEDAYDNMMAYYKVNIAIYTTTSSCNLLTQHRLQ